MEGSDQEKQQILSALIDKINQLNDTSFSALEKLVKDKKVKVNKRITKEELLVAESYWSEWTEVYAEPVAAGAEAFEAKWGGISLTDYEDFFGPKVVEKLLKVFGRQESTGASLIPIKGISKIMQAKLRKSGIYDISGLLIRGKTEADRSRLASALEVDVKLVNAWVKQADLWRVPDMTPDTAYLLVQIGVRHVGDLSRIDENKAYPIIERLSLAQPDFRLPTRQFLQQMIKMAGEVTAYSLHNLSLGIETNEKAPDFLFREENLKPVDTRSGGKIIKEGLDFLDEVVRALPLPRSISGEVYMKQKGENERDAVPFPDALVEIEGVTSSSVDQTEAGKKPSGYTDSEGKFLIVMPDGYNIQDMITLVISQGARKQKFIRSAAQVINSVEEQQMLKMFDRLDYLHQEIEKEESRLLEIGEDAEKANITYEKELLEKELNKILQEIKAGDTTTNNIERIWYNLVGNAHLCAELGKFTLTKEVFEGYFEDHKKALPSVKLMGNDEGDKVIRLSTDTAPSRVFSYGMLQRLVEPVISSSGTQKKREPLSSPVDVMAFKEKLSSDPDEHLQMSSLGIGYVLNMHQAWVPDGFALGSLLYSLALAPGEEQRLVVREKKQSYSVADEAAGTDAVSENWGMSQQDDTTATFNYAVEQLMSGNSKYDFQSKTYGAGGGLGAGGGIPGVFSAMLGLSGGYSKTSGKGSSSSSQSNAHNEASAAAQGFQHNIKSASDKIAQSKRISLRTATSEETDSVATKIIANHNHSHVMTIQYWEVMRRYRLETCIDGVDLVLFVPLKLIRFLPEGEFQLEESELSKFKREDFNKRYKVLVKYADVLQPALPYKYRAGMELVKKFAAYPKWNMEKVSGSARTLTLTFSSKLMECDELSAVLVLKNGRGSIPGNISSYTPQIIDGDFTTREALKQGIRNMRRNPPETDDKITCTFNLPEGFIDDDLYYIRINYSCSGLRYRLHQDVKSLSKAEKLAYDNMLNKIKNLAQDYDDNEKDILKIEHYKSQLPEAFQDTDIYLSASQMLNLGSPAIEDVKITGITPKENNNTKKPGTNSQDNDNKEETITSPPSIMVSGNHLHPAVTITILHDCPVLRYSEFMRMEELMHHLASDPLHYSQVVWGSLSEDERVMMLEQYTIDMEFGEVQEGDKSDFDDMPLLNCVNIKEVRGFYGNCILLPFTYPKRLADKLKKTAAEIQESLYRYHTSCFRVPSTTISLPTDGMIGEAVLGETNVSEIIDLTRFWNWKDSPIDKMNIDGNYLNNTDYLAGKTTGDITALNIQGATAATPVTTSDLLNVLVGKNSPSFNDITGLDQLKEVLNAGTTSASNGRDKMLENSSNLAQKALEAAFPKPEKSGQGNAQGNAQGNQSEGGNQNNRNNSNASSNPSAGNGRPTANADSDKIQTIRVILTEENKKEGENKK